MAESKLTDAEAEIALLKEQNAAQAEALIQAHPLIKMASREFALDEDVRRQCDVWLAMAKDKYGIE